jgi:hypothetical protein
MGVPDYFWRARRPRSFEARIAGVSLIWIGVARQVRLAPTKKRNGEYHAVVDAQNRLPQAICLLALVTLLDSAYAQSPASVPDTIERHLAAGKWPRDSVGK